MAAIASMPVRSTLTVDVDDLTHEQRERLTTLIEDAIQRVVHPEDEPMIHGWTRSTLTAALDRLRTNNANVQEAVIREALRHGGYVTRDRVYRIGKYPKERMLRGFTRPTNRIVAEMKEAGVIPQDAVDLLASSYQDGVQADGFTVNAGLASLLE